MHRFKRAMVCVRFLAVYVVCSCKHPAQVPSLSNMPACPLDELFKRHGNKCLQCGQNHLTKNEAREHAVTHDQTLQPQLEEWRASILALKKRKRCDNSCNRCGQDFSAKAKLTAHQKYCGETATICEYCGKDFQKPQWLRSHTEQSPLCLAKRKAQESASV